MSKGKSKKLSSEPQDILQDSIKVLQDIDNLYMRTISVFDIFVIHDAQKNIENHRLPMNYDFLTDPEVKIEDNPRLRYFLEYKQAISTVEKAIEQGECSEITKENVEAYKFFYSYCLVITSMNFMMAFTKPLSNTAKQIRKFLHEESVKEIEDPNNKYLGARLCITPLKMFADNPQILDFFPQHKTDMVLVLYHFTLHYYSYFLSEGKMTARTDQQATPIQSQIHNMYMARFTDIKRLAYIIVEMIDNDRNLEHFKGFAASYNDAKRHNIVCFHYLSRNSEYLLNGPKEDLVEVISALLSNHSIIDIYLDKVHSLSGNLDKIPDKEADYYYFLASILFKYELAYEDTRHLLEHTSQRISAQDKERVATYTAAQNKEFNSLSLGADSTVIIGTLQNVLNKFTKLNPKIQELPDPQVFQPLMALFLQFSGTFPTKVGFIRDSTGRDEAIQKFEEELSAEQQAAEEARKNIETARQQRLAEKSALDFRKKMAKKEEEEKQEAQSSKEVEEEKPDNPLDKAITLYLEHNYKDAVTEIERVEKSISKKKKGDDTKVTKLTAQILRSECIFPLNLPINPDKVLRLNNDQKFTICDLICDYMAKLDQVSDMRANIARSISEADIDKTVKEKLQRYLNSVNIETKQVLSSHQQISTRLREVLDESKANVMHRWKDSTHNPRKEKSPRTILHDRAIELDEKIAQVLTR